MASNETSKYKLSVVEGTELQLSLNGAQGPTGPANTLSIGTVTTAETGVAAAATITGAAPTQTLNLTLPKGNTGATGPANTLTVSSTTTGAAGTDASVSISGTSPNQSLSFTIPRGDTGVQGPVGPEPSLNVVDNSSDTITLSDSENNKIVQCTASTAVTLTVPSTLAAGFSCMVIQAGTGQVTITAGAGTTLNSFGSLVRTAGQHAPASIIRVASGMYNVSGNLI